MFSWRIFFHLLHRNLMQQRLQQTASRRKSMLTLYRQKTISFASRGLPKSSLIYFFQIKLISFIFVLINNIVHASYNIKKLNTVIYIVINKIAEQYILIQVELSLRNRRVWKCSPTQFVNIMRFSFMIGNNVVELLCTDILFVQLIYSTARRVYYEYIYTFVYCLIFTRWQSSCSLFDGNSKDMMKFLYNDYFRYLIIYKLKNTHYLNT